MDQHPPFLRAAAPLVPMREALPRKVPKEEEEEEEEEEEKGVRGSQGGEKDKRFFSCIALS